jgi:hypothetical protein
MRVAASAKTVIYRWIFNGIVIFTNWWIAKVLETYLLGTQLTLNSSSTDFVWYFTEFLCLKQSLTPKKMKTASSQGALYLVVHMWNLFINLSAMGRLWAFLHIGEP